MTTAATTRQPALRTRTVTVSHLDEVAETLRDEAIEQARGKLGALRRDSDLKRLLDRPDFLDYFMYGLTVRVASVLAEFDQRVLTAYTFEPFANPDGDPGGELPPETLVHLLVLVTQPSAALEAFIASLDRALAAALNELPAAQFEARETMLDVNLISAEDAQLGRGYASLLSAVFAPPLKVWQRDV